jgi:hypothetical protein
MLCDIICMMNDEVSRSRKCKIQPTQLVGIRIGNCVQRSNVVFSFHGIFGFRDTQYGTVPKTTLINNCQNHEKRLETEESDNLGFQLFLVIFKYPHRFYAFTILRKILQPPALLFPLW